MSGIAGIVFNDGRTVNQHLLRQLTTSLAFRGPDAQEFWTFGGAGLGHTLLRTCQEDNREKQPASLDRQTWITADARLDAREELIEALKARGEQASPQTPHCKLLLHAYRTWGEDCVEHIQGDFVFAIWDGRRQKLFCACDHFGIKTLYFAELGDCLVFSNTLECVRAHPEVSNRLNDAAIADFLLFGLNYDPETTSFADIRRLPPAHTLRWSAEGLMCRRYWAPPTEGHIRYRRRAEYVEHFGDLLKEAVADRLPFDRAGILLSGGLDSSSVATMACELRRERFPGLKLHAFTTASSSGERDSDLAAARTVAQGLQIPIHVRSVGGKAPFKGWDDGSVSWAEPMEDPLAGETCSEFEEISKETRVVLSGEGSDNLMEFEMWPHIRILWHERRIAQLGFDLAEHVISRFRAPDGLAGPLRRIGRSVRRRQPRAELPLWLKGDLVKRLELRGRWENPLADIPWKSHAVHPRAYGSLFLPQWTYLFQHENGGVTRQPVEVRYPFLDLRVVSFLLGMPTLPWFFRKHILREATRGKLPEEIRMRAKRPPRESSIAAMLQESTVKDIGQARSGSELCRFVNARRLTGTEEHEDLEQTLLGLRPVCLSYWLQSVSRIGYKMPVGAGHAEEKGVRG
ncbi:MAG TPA: asparagine synthase-related protein [Candidatus Acidoferrales bacterium]|nr:asparagine synthase-related protein [Candidatus Acidoferrales bacterium]